MSADDNQQPSLDPTEGMGDRAREASEEFKEKGKAEYEEEKQQQEEE